MTEETNDKALFRSTRYPVDQAPTLPPDLQWAIGQPEYEITGGVGGGQSTIGSITFAEGSTGDIKNDPAPTYGPGEVPEPKVPTPTIEGIQSSEVVQTMEGVSKANVWITVNGMEGVEYEVVVTAS